MAKYWRNGVNSIWATASNWSDSGPGGASASQAPGANDDAIIPPGVTVTVGAAATCATLTFSGTDATTFTCNSTLTITKGLTLRSGVTVNGTGTILFNNASNAEITIDGTGATLGCNITLGLVANQPSYKLLNNLTVIDTKNCTLASGRLILNSYNLSCGTFINSGSTTRSIDFTPAGLATSCTISGTTLTVGGTVTGKFYDGMYIDGIGVRPYTQIVTQLTGTTNGAGTYAIDTEHLLIANYIGNGTRRVTATVGSTAGFSAGATIVISGAVGTGTEESKLNGTWTIASIDSATTFTFDIASGNTLASATYTGSSIGTLTSLNNILIYATSPFATAKIYLTSTATATVLVNTGSNFTFSGESSFVFNGNTTSAITTTITNTSTPATPINMVVNSPGIYVASSATGCSINGDELTIPANSTVVGPFYAGSQITGAGIPSGTTIIELLTGTGGADSTFRLDRSVSPSVSGITVFTTALNVHNRNGIIAITTGSNFLSLDLDAYYGSFLVTSRTFALYGAIYMGSCIASGAVSASFTLQLQARPTAAFPYIDTAIDGPIEIITNGFTFGDLTVLGGDYYLNSPLVLTDDFSMSNGKLLINDGVTIGDSITLSGGILSLDSACVINAVGTVTHSGGTLKFLSYDTMTTGAFTGSGTGILDLGGDDLFNYFYYQRLNVSKFTIASSTYTIKAYSYYSFYGSLSTYFPAQIGLSGATCADLTISPIVSGGDVGFYSNNFGGNVAFTDNSGKFYWTFAGSSTKVTIGTCNLKGLNTSGEGGTIAFGSSATATIAGPLTMDNTFSSGTTFTFNLTGLGSTEQYPVKHNVACVAPVAINIASGYHYLNGFSLESGTATNGIFTIQSGASLDSGTGGLINCASFICNGTLKHDGNLDIALALGGSSVAQPLTIASGATLKSRNGTTGARVRLVYDSTGTTARTLNQAFTGNATAVAADYLSLAEDSIKTTDITQVYGYWNDVNTFNKSGDVPASAFKVKFNNVRIYGDFYYSNIEGDVTFAGNDNTYCYSTLPSAGLSLLTSVNISKGVNASVTFKHSFINKPVTVNSGILVLDAGTEAAPASSMDITTTTLTIAPNAVLNIAKDINVLFNSTLTVQTGGIVVPNLSTIFLKGTLNGGGATYYKIQPLYYGGLTVVINGNNTIDTLVMGRGALAQITGSNTIGTISKLYIANSFSTILTLNDGTTNIVTNITGYNTGFTLGIQRNNTGGNLPIIKRLNSLPWELGSGTELSGGTTGAIASGTIVNELSVVGIVFERLSASNKFFLFF
jgi:hypothetical protein